MECWFPIFDFLYLYYIFLLIATGNLINLHQKLHVLIVYSTHLNMIYVLCINIGVVFGSSANGQGKHQRVKVDVAVAESNCCCWTRAARVCAVFLRLCARYFAAHHDKHANKLCASADAAPPTDRPTLFRTHVQPCKEIYLTPYLCIMLMWFATSYLPFAPCAYTVCLPYLLD